MSGGGSASGSGSRSRRKRAPIFPNWMDLPELALFDVASRLNPKDLLRFGSVCKPWQSFVKANKTDLTVHQPPLLMICRFVGGRAVCDFYSLTDRHVIHSTTLPGLRDGDRMIRFEHGYIIAVQRSSKRVLAVSPFTGEELGHFPSTSKWVWNVLLTAPPSSPNCVLFHITFDAYPPRHNVLMYCRPGDEMWTRVEGIRDAAISCQGQIYGKTLDGRDAIIEFQPHPRVVADQDKVAVAMAPKGDLIEKERFTWFTTFCPSDVLVQLDKHWELGGLRRDQLEECICYPDRVQRHLIIEQFDGVSSIMKLPSLPEGDILLAECAKSVVPAYIPIIERRKDTSFTEQHKAWQQL